MGGSSGFMARKLKAYQTSLGFFDLAIAAPSMKAALEAWGADSNLFHQGGHKAKKPSSRPVDKAAERKAALAFEKEQKRRERERASEEVARQKERERRQEAVDKAQAALETAEREHAKRAAAIQLEVDIREKKYQAESAPGDNERGRLEAALRHARG
jgi:hypothetical protein